MIFCSYLVFPCFASASNRPELFFKLLEIISETHRGDIYLNRYRTKFISGCAGGKPVTLFKIKNKLKSLPRSPILDLMSSDLAPPKWRQFIEQNRVVLESGMPDEYFDLLFGDYYYFSRGIETIENLKGAGLRELSSFLEEAVAFQKKMDLSVERMVGTPDKPEFQVYTNSNFTKIGSKDEKLNLKATKFFEMKNDLLPAYFQVEIQVRNKNTNEVFDYVRGIRREGGRHLVPNFMNDNQFPDHIEIQNIWVKLGDTENWNTINAARRKSVANSERIHFAEFFQKYVFGSNGPDPELLKQVDIYPQIKQINGRHTVDNIRNELHIPRLDELPIYVVDVGGIPFRFKKIMWVAKKANGNFDSEYIKPFKLENPKFAFMRVLNRERVLHSQNAAVRIFFNHPEIKGPIFKAYESLITYLKLLNNSQSPALPRLIKKHSTPGWYVTEIALDAESEGRKSTVLVRAVFDETAEIRSLYLKLK